MRFILSLIATSALIVAAHGISDSWEELVQLPLLKADTRPVELLDQSSWVAKSIEATKWLTVQLDAVAPVVDISDANGPHLEVVFTVYNPSTEAVRVTLLLLWNPCLSLLPASSTTGAASSAAAVASSTAATSSTAGAAGAASSATGAASSAHCGATADSTRNSFNSP